MNFESQSPNRSDRTGDDAATPTIGPRGQFDTDVIEADLIRSGQPEKPRPRLGLSGLLAWAVVAMVSLSLVSIVAYSQFWEQEKVGGDATSLDLMPIQLQGKLVVAQEDLTTLQGQAAETVLPESMDSGPYEQRLCFAILVNELNGPSEAIDYLEQTDEAINETGLTLTTDQSRLRGILLTLMDQYEQGDLDSRSLPQEDQTLLKDKLQWLGELALVPEGSPQADQRSKLVSEAVGLLIAGVVGLLLAGFVGFVGFLLAVLFLILLANRKLKPGFANSPTDLNIYIETFAIWMCLFFGCSLALGMTGIRSRDFLMGIQPVIFFGSLIALVWPIIRGVPSSQVRKDIGWKSENPFKEGSMSFVTYPATATFLIPGVIVVSIVMAIFSSFRESHEFARQAMPSHPIQEYLANGNGMMIFLVFLTACVAAPVVEETMFRGVLYRHLRDLTVGWRRWISVIFAALLNGVIFASIHPQGIVAVPLLTTLAIGFSLAREWRGSLVCSMVMHGIHNALVTCVVLLIL